MKLTTYGAANMPTNDDPRERVKRSLAARRHTIALALLGLVTLILTVYVVAAPVDNLIIGLVVIVLMIALMLFKIPIAVAMTAWDC